jgi:hypothetical protein
LTLNNNFKRSLLCLTKKYEKDCKPNLTSESKSATLPTTYHSCPWLAGPENSLPSQIRKRLTIQINDHIENHYICIYVDVFTKVRRDTIIAAEYSQ